MAVIYTIVDLCLESPKSRWHSLVAFAAPFTFIFRHGLECMSTVISASGTHRLLCIEIH